MSGCVRSNFKAAVRLFLDEAPLQIEVNNVADKSYKVKVFILSPFFKVFNDLCVFDTQLIVK